MNGKEAFVRIFFGPKVEGTIIKARQDSSDNSIQHILVQTDMGESRHLMQRQQIGWSLTENKLIVTEQHNAGDWFEANVRGKGMVLLPGSKVERDPFELNNK